MCRLPPGATDAEKHAFRVETLQRSVAIAESAGLKLNIEPGFTGDLVKKPETALALLEEVPGLGLSLDFCHFLAAGLPIEKGFQLLSQARQLHVKQTKKGFAKSFYHNGEIDYQAVIRELKRIDWQGDMVLECLAFVPDERFEWKTYTEVGSDWSQHPGEGRLTHPVFQTVALAYEVERFLLES